MKNVFSLYSSGEEVEVEYFFTPAKAGCMYLRNGDPGYPPENEEIEITKIILNGIDIITTICDYDFDNLTENISELENERADDFDYEEDL